MEEIDPSFAIYFKQVAISLIDIEDLRCQLLQNPNFSPHAAFCFLDSKSKGAIHASQLKALLPEVHPCDLGYLLGFRRPQTAARTPTIDYEHFLKLLMPQNPMLMTKALASPSNAFPPTAQAALSGFFTFLCSTLARISAHMDHISSNRPLNLLNIYSLIAQNPLEGISFSDVSLMANGDKAKSVGPREWSVLCGEAKRGGGCRLSSEDFIRLMTPVLTVDWKPLAEKPIEKKEKNPLMENLAEVKPRVEQKTRKDFSPAPQSIDRRPPPILFKELSTFLANRV